MQTSAGEAQGLGRRPAKQRPSSDEGRSGGGSGAPTPARRVWPQHPASRTELPGGPSRGSLTGPPWAPCCTVRSGATALSWRSAWVGGGAVLSICLGLCPCGQWPGLGPAPASGRTTAVRSAGGCHSRCRGGGGSLTELCPHPRPGAGRRDRGVGRLCSPSGWGRPLPGLPARGLGGLGVWKATASPRVPAAPHVEHRSSGLGPITATSSNLTDRQDPVYGSCRPHGSWVRAQHVLRGPVQP